MALYGLARYGVAHYGEDRFVVFDARPFLVTPVDYDKLALSWSMPSGTWDEIALVRNSYGYPSSIYEGITLFTDASGTARLTYLDTDLRQGRFYYYTLFAHDTGGAGWVRAATGIGLVTKDWAFRDVLWEALPQWYRDLDASLVTLAQPLGPLQRMLQLLGYGVDRIRSEAETLLDVNDIDRVSGGLVPLLAEQFGLPFEPELGMVASRKLVKNAVHLFRIKGTLPGIQGLASAYTGFATTVTISPTQIVVKLHGVRENLVPNPSFETNVAGWASVANATLAQTTAVARYGTGALSLTSVAAGDMIARTASGVAGMPVVPGLPYTASIEFRSAAVVRGVQVGVRWYDAAGTALVPDVYGVVVNDAVAAWTRVSVTSTAPNNAAFAALLVKVIGTGAAEVHRVDAALFEQKDQVLDYFDPSLYPDNTDYLWESAVHASRSYYYPGLMLKAYRLNLVLPDWVANGADFTVVYGQQ